MKKFLIIKVNGNCYEVEVEEVRGASAPFAARPSVPVAASVPAPAPAPSSAPVAAGPAGSASITAPMPGTVLKVDVKLGDVVKKGQVLMILEAMKMENEIVSPADGKIVALNVEKGKAVTAGDVLLSIA